MIKLLAATGIAAGVALAAAPAAHANCYPEDSGATVCELPNTPGQPALSNADLAYQNWLNAQPWWPAVEQQLTADELAFQSWWSKLFPPTPVTATPGLHTTLAPKASAPTVLAPKAPSVKPPTTHPHH